MAENPDRSIPLYGRLCRWTLDWPDRDDRWHRYEFTGAKTLAGLLREVDRDPTGIFWG